MLTKAEFDWIVSKVDPLAESVSAVQMEGGISSLIYKVALKTSGKIKYVIVRMIDDKQWLKEEKDLICHEAASLNHVGKIGNIPTPRWIASDVRGKHCRYPALLMGMLPGTVVLQSDNQPMWLEKMAKTLHAIHQIPANDFSWKYYAYHPLSNLRIPNWTKVPDAWRAAFAYMKQGTPAYEPVFLHRDFHPNNVLWEGENVSGVVDWVNACVGPAGIDLGHCRYNLAMLYGVSAAELFLSKYVQLAGERFRYHPYWDLRSLLDVLSDPLEVYAGWSAFGMEITPELMQERMDNYLLKLLENV